MDKRIAKRNDEEGLRQLTDSLTERGVRFQVKPGDQFDKYFIYQIDAEPEACDRCGEQKATPYTSSAFPHLCTDCYTALFATQSAQPRRTPGWSSEWEARDGREGAE